jgi:drug/metabolite transporter (DMT)-like permease
MNYLLISIFFGLLAMVPIGISNGLSPIPTKKIGAKSTLIFRGILTSTLLLIAMLFNLKVTHFVPIQIIYAFAISLIAYIGLLFYYKALAAGKIGAAAPIASGYIIISIALSVIFYRIPLSAWQATFIGLIIFGIILSSINPKDFKNSSIFDIKTGIPFALITALCWGLSFFMAQKPNKELGPYLVGLIIEVGIFCFSLIHSLGQREKIIKPDAKTFGIILAVAVLSVISILGLYLGLKFGNAGIVLTLSGGTSLVVAVYGYFIYKEKLTNTQYFAILLILTGIVALSIK